MSSKRVASESFDAFGNNRGFARMMALSAKGPSPSCLPAQSLCLLESLLGGSCAHDLVSKSCRFRQLAPKLGKV